MMYGRIHYENEAGEFRILDCPSQDVYQRELNIACKWIENEPRRPLGVWAERFITYSDGSIDLAHLAMQRQRS